MEFSRLQGRVEERLQSDAGFGIAARTFDLAARLDRALRGARLAGLLPHIGPDGILNVLELLDLVLLAEVRAQLEAMGHTIEPGGGGFGGYQAIMWDAAKGVYYGASEVRKDGQAAGY